MLKKRVKTVAKKSISSDRKNVLAAKKKIAVKRGNRDETCGNLPLQGFSTKQFAPVLKP